MSTKLLDVDTPIIPLEECRRFIIDCMMAVGTKKEHAEAVGDVLVAADYRGHYSHGMNRLEMYVNDIKNGACDGKSVPEILKETPATAWVDGHNGLGAVVGNFCMDLAMKKAKQVGVGWVCCKGSNHYGIAGMYSLQAIEQGLIGISFTNTSPLQSPTRGTSAVLGTNPIAVGAPAKNGDSFVLDMATTGVALGKIEMQMRKNAPLPEGWAQGPDGKITTNAEVAYKTKCLMPLGGIEINSGYKGYGLAFVVELFSGLLGGGMYGHRIRKWGRNNTEKADLGHCFIALDPKCFAPGYEDRIQDLIDYLRSMKPVDPSKPVLIAGDPERLHMAAADQAGGVRYVPHQVETCTNLAKSLNVTPMQPLDTPIIPIKEARRFIIDCMIAVGTTKQNAEAVADVLTQADYRGHYSHGMNRLEFYANDVNKGVTKVNAVPEILKETPATAWVDGHFGLGVVVGNFCMQLAIKKAKEVGVGWVSCKGSSHFGICAMYSQQAVEEGLIGFSFTNSSPVMSPTRGIKPSLGTNPLSVAAPAKNGDSFVLDMATTVVAFGKIEMALRKNQPIPDNWAQDYDGKSTTDPKVAVQTKYMAPIGGTEITSGYKGYGLAFAVELLCGILSGGVYGHHVRNWTLNNTQSANLGQCFIALDPKCFAPGYEDRIQDLMDHLRSMEPIDPKKPVLVAGDPERQHMAAVDRAGGVRYVPDQLENCERLAKRLNVKPLQPLK